MKNHRGRFIIFHSDQDSKISLSAKLREIGVLPENLPKNSFWYRIKLWLFPYFKESEKLTRQFLEAKIKQEQNIAKKIEAQANLLKMKEIREFSSIINEIFSDDGLPEKAKALKLAKVLENNHNILPLLNSIHEIMANQHQ